MHGILSVGGSSPVRILVAVVHYWDPEGVGTMVLCGPIHDPVLKLFSNSYWV